MQQFQIPSWNTGSLEGAPTGAAGASFGPAQAELFAFL